MKKQRKCQGCKGLFDAQEMHKFTREHKSGKVYLNPASNILGRSAYVCKNPQCIKTVIKKKSLKGALKINDTAQAESLLLSLIVGS